MTDFEPQYPPQRSSDVADQRGYPAPPVGPPRGTNSMAVLAIIFAFVFSPLGIVFGVIARNQIRSTGEQGSGLALAGIVLGAIFTVLFVIYIVLIVLVIGAGLDELFENLPDQQ